MLIKKKKGGQKLMKLEVEKKHAFVDRLTAEGARSPIYNDAIGRTHVSIAFYGLT